MIDASTPLGDLELSTRTFHCLSKHAGVVVLGDLGKFSRQELLRVPNFGKVSLGEIEFFMAEAGVKFLPFPASRDEEGGPDKQIRIEALRAASEIIARMVEVSGVEWYTPASAEKETLTLAEQFAKWLATGER